jgi:hypothetical protein
MTALLRKEMGVVPGSERTGRRILTSGRGPVVTRLSARRIGVMIANDRVWKASRERA